jgi:hypothetical protein
MKKFIFTSNLRRDDTATVAVRLNRQEWDNLRWWMKTPDYHKNIGFPNGVRLYYRGRGWYRLDVTRTDFAIKKLRSAISIIRKWRAEYDEAGRQDQRLRLLSARKTATPIAFVDDGTLGGRIQVMASDRSVTTLQQHVKASPQALADLTAKFGRRS